MGSAPMHRFAILAVALALAAPATAQDSRVWNFDDNPEAPALEFGAPESDDAVIAFSCDPPRSSCRSSDRSARPSSIPVRRWLKLSAGTASLDLTGAAIANETDGTVSIEVTSAPDQRMFALLKAGPSLTIEVPGAKETIPLGGAAPHIAAFERLCFGRK